jgi:hypothetical protein
MIAIRNMEPFAWTVLDTRLMVLAPKPQAPGDRFVTFGVDATLHCPFPASVPPGSALAISFDSCTPTYTPGPKARVSGVNIVAVEGFVELRIDVGVPFAAN